MKTCYNGLFRLAGTMLHINTILMVLRVGWLPEDAIIDQIIFFLHECRIRANLDKRSERSAQKMKKI